MTQTSRYWPFTWNNYTQNDIERLSNLRDKNIRYIVFGREVGEKGTPHLQGYIEFDNGIRIPGVKKLLDPNNGKKSTVHIGDSTGKPSNAKLKNIAIAYCKKGQQPKAEWETLKHLGPNYGKNAIVFEKTFKEIHQGKRTDWHEIHDFIMNNPEPEAVAAAYPEKFIKYQSGIRSLIDISKKKQMDEAMRKKYENSKPKKWQLDLIKELELPANDRSIIWYIDEKGGSGKTWLSNYIVAMMGGVRFENGKSSDIAHAWNGEKIVVFDFTRSMEDHVNYGVIEAIKNGSIFSPKYNSCSKNYASPHVVCFSNFEPSIKKLSLDRWVIRDLKNVGRTVETEKLNRQTLPKEDGETANDLIKEAQRFINKKVMKIIEEAKEEKKIEEKITPMRRAPRLPQVLRPGNTVIRPDEEKEREIDNIKLANHIPQSVINLLDI